MEARTPIDAVTDGRVPLLDGEHALVREVLRADPAWLEAPRTPEWRPSPASRDRFEATLKGVVAFRLHVRAEQNLFKLSQDGGDGLRDRVRDAFAPDERTCSPPTGGRVRLRRADVFAFDGPDANADLADLMRRVDPRKSDP